MHHNSISDAVATGKLYGDLFDKHSTNWTPTQWSVRDYKPKPSPIDSESEHPDNQDVSNGHTGAHFDGQALTLVSEDEMGQLLRNCLRKIEEYHHPILDGWNFSITGDFQKEKKPFWAAIIRQLGGECTDKGAFRKKTTNALLITEKKIREFRTGTTPTDKLMQAMEARNLEKQMVILPERRFYSLLAESEPVLRDAFEECDVAKQLWRIASMHGSNE